MAAEQVTRPSEASAATMMELMCVADFRLGELKDDQVPVSMTGDYLDDVVVDTDVRIILWRPVARFASCEIDRTMSELVDKPYTYLLILVYAELEALLDQRLSETAQLDQPRLERSLADQKLGWRTDVDYQSLWILAYLPRTQQGVS